MFTTFCNSLAAFFPTPDNLLIRIVMILISTVLVAIGIFMYVPTDFIPLAGEGMMLAVSQVSKIKFSTVKLIFDISMVIISLITCLAVLHSLGSVGIGTVIAAVLVGFELKLITKRFGNARDKILKRTSTSGKSDVLSQIMKTDVYTIAADSTIKEALTFISEKKISGAPVVNAAGDMVGFISDGDILRWISSEQSLFVYTDNSQEKFNSSINDLTDMTVSKICNRQVVTVDYDADMAKVCALLASEHLKKIPVVKDGKLVGIINASNITKYIVRCM
jgi:CBS-domain-containing membrane protein